MRLTLFALLLGTSAAADDREEVAKAALAAAKITTFTVAESPDLRVFATLPQTKTTALAVAAQKAQTAAGTALKLGEKAGWDGKLTVYAVTEARQTRALLLFGLKQVGNRETARVDVRAETPSVLVGVSPGEKRSDAQLTADVQAQVATAVLAKAAGDGAELPAWLRVGFGRTVQARADGTKAQAALKAKFKGLAAKPEAKLSPADVWDATDNPDADLLAVGFVDYLVFGPPADKFQRFLTGFKPTDEVQEPTVQTALTAAGLKPEWLADGFKAWLAR